MATDSHDTAVSLDVDEITSLLQAGRYAELEARLRAALRSQPNSGILWKALSVTASLQGVDALHASQQAAALLPQDAESQANLGNALLLGARFGDAAAVYAQALVLDPRSAAVCNNLGNALRGLQRPDEAAARYRQAVELEPDFAEAHSNLGNALRALGQPQEAAASYRQALKIRHHYPEAWNNLGNALFDLEQLDEAAASYRRALEIKPDFAAAQNNLGNTLRSLGEFEAAVASYRRALALQPDFAGAHSNLGETLRELGRVAEAEANCRRAVELAPHLAGAHNALGNLLLERGELHEAEASYRRALALEPHSAETLINLGLVLRQRGSAAQAEASCRAALEAQPAAAGALVLLAELRADDGDFTQAETLLQRAALLDPDSPQALAGMAHLRKMTAGDAAWAAQALRVAERQLPPRQEVYLRFALGKYFDDVGNYPQAFANYRRAHELKHGYGGGYDARQQTLAVEHLIAAYDAKWAQTLEQAPTAAPLAVLIVGMPRSGTTLAEQILASHPAVFGAGELAYWQDAALKSRRALDAGEARGDMLARLGEEYLELLRRMSADAQRVIDKMPANVWCLGLVCEALPAVRIIHMQRDPLDTCLSIYFQHFKNAAPYADSLPDLAHYYGEYRRIMNHWRSMLPPNAMLEVPYESLVADQEAWSRKMVQFIGLPWDSRCLDFHRTSRSVMTASKWQVRQKIHGASIHRWRHYQEFIGPLLTLLARQ